MPRMDGLTSATEALIAAGRRLGSRGLISAGEGNLSIRLDAERLLVTPTGRRKDELAPDDLVVVDGAHHLRGVAACHERLGEIADVRDDAARHVPRVRRDQPDAHRSDPLRGGQPGPIQVVDPDPLQHVPVGRV